jgi:signal transduction histidine kinase
LTVSVPLELAVVLLFQPSLAALVAFVGCADPREFRREVSLFKALFNRSQVAVSIFLAGLVFHSFADLSSHVPRLAIFGLVALLTFELANASFAALALVLEHHLSPSELRRELAGQSLLEFLFFYLGIGLLGIPLAEIYTELPGAEWVVVFFMLPLFLLRQMFARSSALERATTELRERERVLSLLSNRMAEERYDERKQIASYLHDDLAQKLFRLGLQADAARSGIEKGNLEKAGTALDSVEGLKDESIKLVRGLIRDLDRSPLGRAGLATALATLASDHQSDGAVRFHLDITDRSLPAPIQLLAYQIAREAVGNAMKHATPKNIWVSVQPDGSDLVLRIRDDGSGFETGAPPPDGHFGLSIMRERAALAGGELKIVSLPGAGTEVVVDFPQGSGEKDQRPEIQVGDAS